MPFITARQRVGTTPPERAEVAKVVRNHDHPVNPDRNPCCFEAAAPALAWFTPPTHGLVPLPRTELVTTVADHFMLSLDASLCAEGPPDAWVDLRIQTANADCWLERIVLFEDLQDQGHVRPMLGAIIEALDAWEVEELRFIAGPPMGQWFWMKLGAQFLPDSADVENARRWFRTAIKSLTGQYPDLPSEPEPEDLVAACQHVADVAPRSLLRLLGPSDRAQRAADLDAIDLDSQMHAAKAIAICGFSWEGKLILRGGNAHRSALDSYLQ